MATDLVTLPSLSTRFWWGGALKYIDSNEENYQRSFLLLISCIASLGHEFEKHRSYDWSGSVRLNTLSKALVSASHYWRVYDFSNGLKGGG